MMCFATLPTLTTQPRTFLSHCRGERARAHAAAARVRGWVNPWAAQAAVGQADADNDDVDDDTVDDEGDELYDDDIYGDDGGEDDHQVEDESSGNVLSDDTLLALGSAARVEAFAGEVERAEEDGGDAAASAAVDPREAERAGVWNMYGCLSLSLSSFLSLLLFNCRILTPSYNSFRFRCISVASTRSSAARIARFEAISRAQAHARGDFSRWPREQ